MDDRPLIYTAQSKQDFYCRDAICQFVFERGGIPLNPFRMFDYFLGDRVPRALVREGNRRILETCDEVWVFGENLADGVLVEIAQARMARITVRYFSISPQVDEIRAVDIFELNFEPEVSEKSGLGRDELHQQFCSSDPATLIRAMGRLSEIASA